MAISDVLRKPSGEPIELGLTLYRIFAQRSHLVLLGDRDDRDDELEGFLRTERLNNHAFIAKVPAPFDQDHLLQVTYLRNNARPIELVVEADPDVAGRMFVNGFPVLHFMAPAFARPSWRPDFVSSPAPWQELVATRVAEEELATERERIRQQREGGF